MRVQIRRQPSGAIREAADAAPADEPRKLVPGRLRDPPWGHYDPCARCSLKAPAHRGAKRGPELGESRKAFARAAAERREARRPALLAGHLRRTGDGSARETDHGVRRLPHQRLSALCSPHTFSGNGKQTRGAPSPTTSGRRSFGWMRMETSHRAGKGALATCPPFVGRGGHASLREALPALRIRAGESPYLPPSARGSMRCRTWSRRAK